MSARHHAGSLHHLYVAGDTPVHRVAPEAKIAGLTLFAVAVALTPRHAVAAFAVDAAVLAIVIAIARLPPRVVAVRLMVIVPFIAFAVLIPFVATGPQVDVLGVSMSVDGLWSTWNIVAKASLGATASIVLSATTPLPDIVHGLTRLRVPRTFVAIIAFMFRYLDVLGDQVRRMRNAMTARCHDPRWLWQARPIASSAGVLFVRSYERGERIHQAMLARGYTGAMPEIDERRAAGRDWTLAAVPAVIAMLTLAGALVLGGR